MSYSHGSPETPGLRGCLDDKLAMEATAGVESDKPSLLDSFITLGVVVFIEVIYGALGFLDGFTFASF